jgi:lysophospholipid hydrolase
VGGTSIGAFVGGLYAMKGGDMSAVSSVFDAFAQEMSSVWNKIRDLTFPIVAYMKGHQFNRGLVRVFGDTNMEDFWTGFYCVSTDLTDSREIIHRNGYAWKYVRASMTLTGFIPPICDVQIEKDEPVVHYLVDGGYVDNLPVDDMRKIVGASGTIIAVDVQSAWRLMGDDYGEDLNGWWYLWRWISPFHTTPKIPTDSDIQSHLAFISCVQRFGKTMTEAPVDLYIVPPLHNVSTMEFSKAKAVQEHANEAVLEKVKLWVKQRESEGKDPF